MQESLFDTPVNRTYKGHRFLGDFHTHSIYSLHAMSSPSEMAAWAAKLGLRYLAITDHFYPAIHTSGVSTFNEVMVKNQEARMWEIPRRLGGYYKSEYGLNVIPGYEYSIIPAIGAYGVGTEDMMRQTMKSVGVSNKLNILSAHSWYTHPDSYSFSDILEAIDTMGIGRFHIIGHPDREMSQMQCIGDNGKYLDRIEFYCCLLDRCADKCIPVELNEGSVNKNWPSKDYALDWLKIAKDMGILIVVNSDAHVSHEIGDFTSAIAMLESIDFPADQIINLDKQKIKECLLSSWCDTVNDRFPIEALQE